jgi:hypothetical protein
MHASIGDKGSTLIILIVVLTCFPISEVLYQSVCWDLYTWICLSFLPGILHHLSHFALAFLCG